MSCFYFNKNNVAYAYRKMNNDTVCNLFNSFTNTLCDLSVECVDTFSFSIGNVPMPCLEVDMEFIFTVKEGGVSLIARDYPSLMRGYFALLTKIEWDLKRKCLCIEEKTVFGKYKTENRMIHLCVFPENSLFQIKRLIRLCAALQFTHVVLEFWGMLKFDTLCALSWENAFSKDEVRELLKEACELGLEMIPMFNSLGHASQSRSISGKHTVLDNDPSLFYLFTPDGWAWDLENEDVWALLKKIRLELYELFEGCKYFHCGFDESHILAKDEHLSKRLPEFMQRLTNEISGEGKIPIIWIDMLLPQEAYVGFPPNAHSVKSSEECLKILSSLNKNTVLVDWEYGAVKSPISTLTYYRDTGFKIMGAPWLLVENGYAHIDTIEENKLFGLMQTTWHTLYKDIDKLMPIASYFGASLFPWIDKCPSSTATATLLRKLSFEKKIYDDCGFSKNQITNSIC